MTFDRTAPTAPTLSIVGHSGGGSITTTTTPIHVSLATSAAAGDTLRLKDGTQAVASATLTAADMKNGYVDISVPTPYGSHSLTATETDLAGNLSSPASLHSGCSNESPKNQPGQPPLTGLFSIMRRRSTIAPRNPIGWMGMVFCGYMGRGILSP